MPNNLKIDFINLDDIEIYELLLQGIIPVSGKLKG